MLLAPAALIFLAFASTVTELGEVVNQIMKESFPSIVDEHFTANMESLLDSVGEGTVNWKTVIENFYPDLEKAVEAAEKDLEKVKIEDEVTDVVCDVCGRNMVVKYLHPLKWQVQK